MKTAVAILGATGCVGQKFIQLLSEHPWFEIVSVCASERNVGKKYSEAVNWLMPSRIPEKVANLIVEPCKPNQSCKLAFSGLDSSVAGDIELEYAQAGYTVVSNSRNHRMDPKVPLVIPEVNAEHFELLKSQPFSPGRIVTNPNCSVIGIVIALKPLIDLYGIDAVHVTTMQAISGAGHPGVASLDIMDNVIPFIKGEEEKVETEPLKILGQYKDGRIIPAEFIISAQCNRVPVTDGHTACISVKLKSKASKEDIIAAWHGFAGEPQKRKLPSAPIRPIHYFDHDFYPQPRFQRDVEQGMAVSIGRLRPCALMGYKFTILSHNTVRGAAGAAILNAELLHKK